MDKKHSLKIKTMWFEASAEGYGVAALFVLLLFAGGSKLWGWW